MHRRLGGYGDGALSLPSGHVDGRETVLQAAAREVAEEVGVAVDASLLRVLTVQHRPSLGASGERREYFDFYVDAPPGSWSGEPRNAEPRKASEVVWHDVSRLPPDTLGHVRAALASLRSGLNPHCSYGWSDGEN